MVAVQVGVDELMQGTPRQALLDPLDGLIGVGVVTTVDQRGRNAIVNEHTIGGQPATLQHLNTQGIKFLKRHKFGQLKSGLYGATIVTPKQRVHLKTGSSQWLTNNLGLTRKIKA
jgi:hypothetical protein